MAIVLVVPEPKEKFTSYGPPLGLCYISAYLKMKGFQDVKGVDLNIDSTEDLKRLLKDHENNIVGIYCATKSFNESIEFAKIAKANGSIVIMGGPHPTLCPEEILQNENADFVVIGEGEINFYELVTALYENKSFEEIGGIGYKNNQGEMVVKYNNNFINDLDSLPFPDRELFDPYKYHSEAMTILATRGCPYACKNCKPALDFICGKYRIRSVENILTEIKDIIISKYNYNSLHFVDNDLTVHKKWITEFCNKIIEEELKFTWGCQGGVKTLDKDLMTLMKDAGCTNIGIGIESGSQRVLDEVIHKKINLIDAKNVVDGANEVGIGIHVWFMIGIPLETIEEMIETVKLASSLSVSSIGFSIGTPWPKTGFYEICEEKGFLLTNKWGEYNEKRYCKIKTDDFSPEDIEKCRQTIFEIFKNRRWFVDKTNFIMYNPYYNNSSLGNAKIKLLLPMINLFGQERLFKIYDSFKMKVSSWHRERKIR